MILAHLTNGHVVEIENVLLGYATVRNLGRDSIGYSYVGGVGYIGTPFTTIGPEQIAAVTVVDPQNCPALMIWQETMRISDKMTEWRDPNTAAAIAVEARALESLIEFIHANPYTAPNRPVNVREFHPAMQTGD